MLTLKQCDINPVHKYDINPVHNQVFDRNWNKLWERNIGDYGMFEDGGYGVTRMVELNRQYYCWRTSEVVGEIGFLFRLDENGTILNKWRERDSSFFQTLIKSGDRIFASGNRFERYKGDNVIGLYLIDSNFTLFRRNLIGFRDFYDTSPNPLDSNLYHMDVSLVRDGGYFIFNWGSSRLIKKYHNSFANFDILFKTDSCGYTQGDTCKLVVKIDSIRNSTVYLSIDQLRYKVCGRRWHVDGQVRRTENLVYTFSDTGTYNIGTNENNAKQFVTNNIDTGYVYITKIDTIKGFVSGRFEFTARYYFGSAKKRITEGRFDLKY
jgi:hypothetical protein